LGGHHSSYYNYIPQNKTKSKPPQLKSCIVSYTKINSKRITYLNVKATAVKFLGRKIPELGLDEDS
jgi:hypothetical protein